MGPRKSDPNADSGSLSVILVVILPVVQMFFFVALIILVRMCYRRYCLRKAKPKQLRRPVSAVPMHRSNGKLKLSTPANLKSGEKLVSIAMTSSSAEVMPSTSNSASGEKNGITTINALGEVEIDSNVDEPLGAVPGSSTSRSGSGSTVAQPVTGLSTATVHRNSRSSSVSPVDALATVCPTRGTSHFHCTSLANDYQIGSTLAVAASSLKEQTAQCSNEIHSLPLSMPVSVIQPSDISTFQRAQLLRSSTLNDAIESLNSETIESVGADDDEVSGQVSVELPLDRCNSHQSECIYHPRRSNSSRPSSVNSINSFKCMQTY